MGGGTPYDCRPVRREYWDGIDSSPVSHQRQCWLPRTWRNLRAVRTCMPAVLAAAVGSGVHLNGLMFQGRELLEQSRWARRLP